MGRESSLGQKELFDLPSLVLKAKHLGGSYFCNFYRLGVPEQALGRIPLGFGIVIEDKPSEFSCTWATMELVMTMNRVPKNDATPLSPTIQ